MKKIYEQPTLECIRFLSEQNIMVEDTSMGFGQFPDTNAVNAVRDDDR